MPGKLCSCGGTPATLPIHVTGRRQLIAPERTYLGPAANQQMRKLVND